MIVVRAFLVMGQPTAMIDYHHCCCRHGGCDQPCQRRYAHETPDAAKVLGSGEAALWAACTQLGQMHSGYLEEVMESDWTLDVPRCEDRYASTDDAT